MALFKNTDVRILTLILLKSELNYYDGYLMKINMRIQVKKVPRSRKTIIERLMQLYLYDFNIYYNDDVNSLGLFTYAKLDSYWGEEGKYPFLIYVDDKIAGFALVSSHTYLQENKGGKSIAEFFVMPKYRRRGVGTYVAHKLFDMFPGKWEVSEINDNIPAIQFWRFAINKYTKGKYKETILDNEVWSGPIQSFDNSEKLKLKGKIRNEK